MYLGKTIAAQGFLLCKV